MSLASEQRPSSLSLLLLTELALVVLIAWLSLAAASRDFLEAQCTHVVKEQACLRFLDRVPWALSCRETKCLAGGILNNICLPKTRRAHDFADTGRRRSRTRGDDWNMCVGSYDDVEILIERSLDEFNEGNIDEAGNILAPRDYEMSINNCANAFDGKPSPMTSWNHLVMDCMDVAADFFLDMVGRPALAPAP